MGCPIYTALIDKGGDDSAWRLEALKRLPGLTNLDGRDVTDEELEAAAA